MSTEQTGFVGWIKSRTGLAFLGFTAVAAYFLWTEHRAHVIQFLPFVLLLLCPLLHLLHGGHGGDSGGHDHSREGDKR